MQRLKVRERDSPSFHMLEKSSIVAATEKFLREHYSPVQRNNDEKVSGAIASLMETVNDRRKATQWILEETVRMIHRSFEFQSLSIALRDRDHDFKYAATTGISEEAKKVLFSIHYSESELFDESIFPHTSISDITKFFMSESEPYQPGEETTFFRPVMLAKRRESPEEMLPGDYIDFVFRNRSNEIMGFIEVGETRTNRLPERSTILWLELIATLLGAVLCNRLEG